MFEVFIKLNAKTTETDNKKLLNHLLKINNL